VRSRRYDDEFWQELQGKGKGKMSKESAIEELGF
jgi:hypothetical protein